MHTNTAGVFKGFYTDRNTGIGKFGGTDENALERILGRIEISKPVLSDKTTAYCVMQQDANELVKSLRGLDLVYIDPPYNQHSYGSNYHMLNTIAMNKISGNLSEKSGIPNDYNKSKYNNKHLIKETFTDLITNINSKYIIASYSSEGYLSRQESYNILSEKGTVSVEKIDYNTFRGSRNLNERDTHITEYLFTVHCR